MCDERLKTKAEESTHLGYTGLFEELEHLKIETRLMDEKFASQANFDFEMGRESRVAVVQDSTMCLRKLNT